MGQNIEQIIENLKKMGIDTTRMSEEEIRKLASTINDMFNTGYGDSKEALQKQVEEVRKSSHPKITRQVVAPANLPAQPTDTPRSDFPNSSDLGQGNNKGLNYTDDNKYPRDAKQPVNPPNGKVAARPQESPYGSSTVPGNDEKVTRGSQGMNTNTLPNKEGVDAEKGKANKLANNDLALGTSPEENSTESSQLGGAPGLENEDENAKSNPDQLPDLKVKEENIKTPGIRPDGTFEEKIRPQPTPVESPSTEEVPQSSAAANDSSDKSDKQPGKNENNNGKAAKNNAANTRKNRAKAKNAVADDKIKRAKNRLKQNGIDPDKRANPRKRQLASSVNPLNRPEETSAEANGSQGGAGPQSPRRESSPLSRLRNRLRSGLRGNVNRKRDVEDTYNDPKDLSGGIKDKAKRAIKNKIRVWVMAHLPMILLVTGVVLSVGFIIFLIVVILFSAIPDVFGIEESSADIQDVAAGNQTSCRYGAAGNLGQTAIKNVKVELINCDGTSSKYETLATLDFENYVLGVALAEIGESAPDEAIKAQIIAARTFALSRNKGMCPSDPDNCFYGYNKKSNVIRMRACENDQVYWDYTKDSYRVDRGAISLYSPEVKSGSLWKTALGADRIRQVEALADEVKGQVLVDSSGNTIEAGYKSSDQKQIINEANNGKTYKEILRTMYGVGTSDGSNCQLGNIDYHNYQLDTSNSNILHQPLASFLQSKGTSIGAFNQLIQKNVQDAGVGTRAGVVAAAVTLIGELSNQYNVKVPYFWGGGHDQMSTFASGNWGSSSCHDVANGQVYEYCGLDCSGFVGWSIYNGGYRNATTTAANYKYTGGARDVSLSNSALLQPADLLYNSHHIILVIGVDTENNQYICAEAAGNSSGVIFSRHSFDGDGGNLKGLDMTAFYENNANKRV